ncbi:hypothetical protein RHAB21_02550 [Pseudorhizobium halotolerans]|uniref:Uncharacterized protein n=1 Tax=Pseudorhizobium halotolerans TaxID=1233081 RepID=A0ABN7JMV5_9HYPH|nr:hypothetical protein [Pseudorhizobium halotolerans]CAD7036635.1 hypothetical protein RHAB21_02550 [Pseudorhizobium halotolerans]
MTTGQPTPGVHENFAADVAETKPQPLGYITPAALEQLRLGIDCQPIHKDTRHGFTVPIFDHPPRMPEPITPPPPESHLMGPDFGSHGSAIAIFDVITERLRQQEKEGWTPEHDDAHEGGELAQAAAVYAHPFKIKLAKRRGEYDRGTNPWPWYEQVDVSGGRGDFPVWGWEPAWLKKTDRRRDLVKAAALIIAEIERLDRAALATTECLPE